jgi:hypothetical protein
MGASNRLRAPQKTEPGWLWLAVCLNCRHVSRRGRRHCGSAVPGVLLPSAAQAPLQETNQSARQTSGSSDLPMRAYLEQTGAGLQEIWYIRGALRPVPAALLAVTSGSYL